jgi:hypothetical protein
LGTEQAPRQSANKPRKKRVIPITKRTE